VETAATWISKRLRARTPVRPVVHPVRKVSLDYSTWPAFWLQVNWVLFKHGYTQASILFYRQVLRAFSCHVGKPPREVVSADLHAYLATLPRDRVSWHWTAMNLSVLRTVFDKLGGLRALVAQRGPRRKRPLPEHLTRDDVRRIWDAAGSPRDRILVGLLYGCGLKTGELRRLTWGDINLEARTVRVPSRWGRPDRYLPMPTDLVALLKAGVGGYQPGQAVMAPKPGRPAISGRRIQLLVRNMARKAGMSSVVLPVTLRNSYAVHFLEDGGTIRALQVNLDHRFLATTARYLDVQQQSDTPELGQSKAGWSFLGRFIRPFLPDPQFLRPRLSSA